ncbi:DivIVA domain-containing protein [Kribbella solani]|uniref:Cell wall synthesis protein Wag31 n=1 Tax=Kribbella solani TaxID=236067 RepID=A0A841DDG0_9ACTN|nr:DivIVA domain-containing protein [Kribbella solani]MBB5977094.1 DivIVA domain-containing protein [Kribbella solani]
MLESGFTVRRSGQRYDCTAVDALVERLVATVERRSVGPDLTVADLRAAQFGTPMFGPGYAVEEVDNFLAEAERLLPARDGVAGQRAVAQSGRPVQGELTKPSFSRVRLREGYARDEVDAFVDRVLATVNGLPVDRPVTAQEILNTRFRTVRLSEGYDATEVDLFVDTTAARLDGMIGQ